MAQCVGFIAHIHIPTTRLEKHDSAGRRQIVLDAPLLASYDKLYMGLLMGFQELNRVDRNVHLSRRGEDSVMLVKRGRFSGRIRPVRALNSKIALFLLTCLLSSSTHKLDALHDQRSDSSRDAAREV